MARIRTIKPEFPQSESMGRVSREARLLFILLWTIVDDAGRTRAASRMLASLLYPYDDDAVRKIVAWIDELSRERSVVIYSNDGNTYLQIVKWLQHQRIDKPTPSRLPAPTDTNSRTFATIREASCRYLVPSTLDLGVEQDLGKGPRTDSLDEESSGESEENRTPAIPEKTEAEWFAEFWRTYPRRVARVDAVNAFAKAAQTTDPKIIIAGAMLVNTAAIGRNLKFVPHPATWLNGKRWNDEEKPNYDRHERGNAKDIAGALALHERLFGDGAQAGSTSAGTSEDEEPRLSGGRVIDIEPRRLNGGAAPSDTRPDPGPTGTPRRSVPVRRDDAT